MNGKITKLVRKLALGLCGLPKEDVVDLYELMGGDALSRIDLFMDHVHCNDFGYQTIAKAVLGAMDASAKGININNSIDAKLKGS